MIRKRTPPKGGKPPTTLRRIGGRPGTAARNENRGLGNRPKRMIMMVILLLIASLLMKRVGGPVHTLGRAPLSGGMNG
jgi:hypothetical protein